MKTRQGWLRAAGACVLVLVMSGSGTVPDSATVPMMLDHNRMMIDVEFQRTDGSWRTARLWIDTGNPHFFMNESFARDLGIDLPASGQRVDVPPPAHVRVGGMPLDFGGVASSARIGAHWPFSGIDNDGNLPSTVLQKYHVVFDYPGGTVTIAKPGAITPRGVRAAASIHPETGIPQIDAVVDGDSMSFALDMGASYSFISSAVLDRLRERHPDWPHATGTSGCANMWGYWPPHEETLPVVRVPEILWGGVRLTGVAMVGVPQVWDGGPDMGAWYSQKTARPVAGFLGPNAFDAFRVEIDYAAGAIYFEKGPDRDYHDLDLVGLSLRPEQDGSFTVIGVVEKDGKPLVDGVEPGDVLRAVDGKGTSGATLGAVVDALRGTPGEVRVLELERDGKRFTVDARVTRVL